MVIVVIFMNLLILLSQHLNLKKKYTGGKKNLARWSKSEPLKWKKNLKKEKKKSGAPYVTKKGSTRAKSPKDVDCVKCRWQCSAKFDNNTRKQLCSSFWQLDYCRQKDFISKCVLNEPAKTRRIRTGAGPVKNFSRVYYFYKGENKIRVCKQFFLKTLSISHGPVENALAGINENGLFMQPDKRGKKVPPNKTDPAVMEKVKAHIESFPTMESHYCRKTTKRVYLDSSLSIKKMYELYVEEVREREKTTNDSEKVVSEMTYRRYFCEQYNLSFFKPKKDQCVICDSYAKSTSTLGNDEMAKYEAHIKRKQEAYKAKASDKLRAETDSSFLSASFDLQSVLQVPSSNASPMYYSRKICVYNLAIYEAASPNTGYCFLWSEINGKRGSCEIGTALLHWIQQIPNNIKEISLFSDTCGGQNRNQFITALFLYVVQRTHLEIFEQKFMESGHSYLEADSMHSAIETAKRNISVYTVNDWINIMIMARSNRGRNKNCSSYIVKELHFSDFVDLKHLGACIVGNKSLDSDGKKVRWLQIKVLRFEKKQPGVVLFKYSIEDVEFKKIQIYGQDNPPVMPETLNSLYRRQLPISSAKKKDLLKLCNNKTIPQEFHGWYKSLPVDRNITVDVAPEPTIDSDDCEEAE